MKLNLRQRIAGALFGLATLGAGVMATLLWTGHFWLESRTLDGILERELEVYAEAGTTPQQMDTVRTGLRLYRPKIEPRVPPPAPLNALAPGSHRDFALGDGVYHVLVRDLGAGDRMWLLYDVREFERRESWLLLALAAAVILVGLLAWGIGGRVSRRLLEPLNTLTQQLRALDWTQRTHRLTPAQSDDDMQVIVSALNRLLSEVDELMQRERAFASAASHELRTPLASIRAAAEVLAAQTASQTEPLARIERAVTAASRDLDALLALSRSRKLPQAEALALDSVLPQMAEAHLAAANGIRVEWQLGAQVLHAPRSVLEIIFTNLLRNGLRAARERVVVRVDSGGIAIEDDGGGIADELRPHLFEPGVKGSDGGSGMGLYIARTLAERAGWSIELRPRDKASGTRAFLRF